MIDNSVREKIAEVQHSVWSHWTKYQFSRCTKNPDGSLNIPPELIDRWQRQSETSYAELTDEEKESDRHQADKVLKIAEGTNWG